MHNDPELDPKFLGKISSDFVKVADHLKEASYQIRARKFSQHPFFVIAKQETPLGSLLFANNDLNLEWNYHASYLEIFTEAKILEEDKVEAFKNTYKDPDEYCCLFVVSGEFQNFVYIPYPID
ncbi:MAG: hypothetical protein LAT68_00385 [Cyclobacteriaceae bacterium]|nr:hypothetical protein [Cyclobacteriaceae bacterium]MCH8514759.1 hypothetical protein [Cyclobacteriaceae bacterium]